MLYNLGNSVQYYPENQGNCISGIPDFKIFPRDPPRLFASSGRDYPPQLQCPGAATVQYYTGQQFNPICAP